MMKTKFICILFTISSFLVHAQNDTNIYTYNCIGCGNYTLITSEVLEIETTVNISSETKQDTGTTTLALFSTTSNRKANKPQKIKEGKNYFTVFPNPAKNNYFLYFDSQEKCEGYLMLQDMYGRTMLNEKIFLKKGMNVLEKSTMNYGGNNYFLTAIFNNKVFKQKILFVK